MDLILGQDGSSQSQASEEVAMEITNLGCNQLCTPSQVLETRQLWSMLGLLLYDRLKEVWSVGLVKNEYGNPKRIPMNPQI